MLRSYCYVAIGGFCGSITRYGIASHMPLSPILIIVLINIIGSFLLALLYSYTTLMIKWSTQLRLLIGTGFLGAFTTFSTFSLDLVQLINNGQPIQAILYIITSVVGGGCAAAAGIYISNQLVQRKGSVS